MFHERDAGQSFQNMFGISNKWWTLTELKDTILLIIGPDILW